MGRSSRAGSLVTRHELLQVARGLFVERGFERVGLEDVAAGAGVTRGAVYHHFGGKRSLFEAVAADVHGEVAEQVARAAAEAGPGWPGIRAGCVAFLDAAAAPAVRRILLVDAPVVLGWQHWRSVDARNSRRLLEEGLVEIEAAGGLRSGDAEAGAILLSGAMNEAALWLAEEPAEGARERVDRLLDGMIASLRA